MRPFWKSSSIAGIHYLVFALILGVCLVGCSRSSSGFGIPGFGFVDPNAWTNALLWDVNQLDDAIDSGQDLIIIDCRMSEALFDTGHIEDAIWVNYQDIAPNPPVTFPIPGVEAYFGARGIERTDTIVLYGEGSLLRSATFRFFWLFEYYGCEKVYILDGGLQQWVLQGKPLNFDAWSSYSITPVTFDSKLKPSILAEEQQVHDLIEDHETTTTALIDARTPWEYTGEACARIQDRTGRIPYSTHLWWLDTIDENTDKIKSPPMVKGLLNAAGATAKNHTIAVATTGARSTEIYFLCRLSGYSCSVYHAGILQWSDVEFYTPPPPPSPLELRPMVVDGPFVHKSIVKLFERAPFGGSSAVFGGQVYIFGGIYFDALSQGYKVTDMVWRFNPSCQPWLEGIGDGCWNKISQHFSTPRCGMGAATVPGENVIYLFGGCDGGGNVSDLIMACRIDPVTLDFVGMKTLSVKLPKPLHGMGCVYSLAHEKIIIFGGSETPGPAGASDAVYEFTPITKPLGPAITPLASLPGKRFHSGSVALNGNVYSLGGEDEATNLLDEVLEYDYTTDTWNQIAPMSMPRLGVKGATAFGRIYMCGGFTFDPAMGYHTTGTVESFNPVSNTWHDEEEMTIPRYNHFMESVGTRIYLVGGYDGPPHTLKNNIVFPNVVEYRPAFKRNLKAIPDSSQYGGATVRNGNKIFLIGGYQDTMLTDRVLVYDTVNDLWGTTNLDPYPEGPTSGLSAVPVGNTAIVFGGDRGAAMGLSPATYLFDPSQPSGSQWTKLADMNEPRTGMAAVYWATDGFVYAVGGKNSSGLGAVSTLAYDVATDTWVAFSGLDILPTGRSWSSAALLDDKIFLVGGLDNNGDPVADTLALELAGSKTWMYLGDMPTARYAMGTAVIGRRIYTLGGFSEDAMGRSFTTDAYEVLDTLMARWERRPGLKHSRAWTFAASSEPSIYVIGGYNANNGETFFRNTVELGP